MNKKEITLQNERKVTAQGNKTGKNCTPVYCVTTERYYTSVSDAAQALDIKYGKLADHLLGRTKYAKANDGSVYKFCRARELADNIPMITEATKSIAEKAKRYDQIVSKHKAIVESRERVNSLKGSVESAYTAYTDLLNALEDEQVKLETLEREMSDIF